MKFLPALFMILCATAVFAHNGILKGVVRDESHLPLKGATVLVVSTGKATTTNAMGSFQFDNLAPGSYVLAVSYVGFETQRDTVALVENSTIEISFDLRQSDVTLSEVTVAANPVESINSISAIDIKLRPIRTSQDILRIVPGLFIAQHAGGGKAEQIFLRGFDIDHGTDINLTVDGMPVNMVSHAHGQGYADLHFLIPETVEQVNFEKGPYYAQKGNLATAGFVAFQTRNALKNNLLKLEGGQFNTGRAVAMLSLLDKSTDTKKENAYVASEYFFSQGYFDAPQNFNRINLFGKYNGYLSGNKILSASFSTFSSSWDASGQIPQRAINSGTIGRFGAIDNTEGGTTSRTNANLQLAQVLDNKALISNQLYFATYAFDLYSNFTFFLKDSINGDQIRQREKRNIIGYNGTYNQTSTFLGKSLTSEIGLGLRYDDIRDIELSHTVKRRMLSTIRRGDIRETNLSTYINESWAVSDRLVIHAGLRLDYFLFDYVDKLDSAFARKTQNRSVISPKLNLFYTINPAIKWFINSGIGFHSNDTRVIIDQTARAILPKAYGGEVGIAIKPIENLLIKGSLWRLDLDQEFVYVGDDGIVEPGGKTRRTGIDLSVRYQLLRWLYADWDVNLARPRMKNAAEGENYIPLAPILTSIGGLTSQFKNGFSGSLRYRYLANRPANETNSVVANGYYLMDAVVRYIRPTYEVGLSIENIFNQRWKEAQFDTESRLRNERLPVSENHFTPGTPFSAKLSFSYFF
jgi:outer membrane cobalamin receptor